MITLLLTIYLITCFLCLVIGFFANRYIHPNYNDIPISFVPIVNIVGIFIMCYELMTYSEWFKKIKNKVFPKYNKISNWYNNYYFDNKK